MGRLNPSRETKFSGTHGDRGMFIFPVQPTTSRIGNLPRLIHALLYVMTIHTYIHRDIIYTSIYFCKSSEAVSFFRHNMSALHVLYNILYRYCTVSHERWHVECDSRVLSSFIRFLQWNGNGSFPPCSMMLCGAA